MLTMVAIRVSPGSLAFSRMAVMASPPVSPMKLVISAVIRAWASSKTWPVIARTMMRSGGIEKTV
jgi:hypothetical protein